MASLASQYRRVSMPLSPPPSKSTTSGHRYGERVALDDVSFAVASGEIFGLLGPNGGGKTTLFKIVSTLLFPTEGTVRVFGDDVVRDPAAVRRRLGVVFQHPALDGRLTVEENLRHQGHLYGLSGRTAGRSDRRGARARRGSTTGGATWWPRCRAASSGGPRWPRRCCTGRSCSSSTSRARASTRPRGATSGRTSRRCAARKARRSS